MELKKSILRTIFAFLFIIVIIFLTFVFVVFKYMSDYDKFYVLELAKIAKPELNFNDNIDILPMFCLPDITFYYAFGCGDVKEEAFGILSNRFASQVLANMDSGTLEQSGSITFPGRALFRLSEKGDLEAQPVDIPEYNKNLNLSFDCEVVTVESNNIFFLPIRLSICSYRGQFVYSVLLIKNLYGFPPNPIGEALLPIRVADWRILRELL